MKYLSLKFTSKDSTVKINKILDIITTKRGKILPIQRHLQRVLAISLICTLTSRLRKYKSLQITGLEIIISGNSDRRHGSLQEPFLHCLIKVSVVLPHHQIRQHIISSSSSLLFCLLNFPSFISTSKQSFLKTWLIQFDFFLFPMNPFHSSP